ncbi:galanin-like G-protein coupled receptor npr-9 [Babylonia areolata]|uniref:galanin-like G-protein coupled receptor npr-9 n=1 Tax=Babylonia areolata TaxID=304850 RepID=UPI003FD33825
MANITRNDTGEHVPMGEFPEDWGFLFHGSTCRWGNSLRTGASCFRGARERVPMGEFPEDWGFLVQQCVGHVIVLVGLVGNCLSFVVMKAKALRHKSYSHYLCALAVFDSMVLVTREARYLDALLTYFHHPGVFRTFSTPACKLFLFTETLSCLVSSWLVVAMALERLLVVYRPFRKNVLCTQKGALVVITSIFVICCYTQVFRLVMVVSDNGRCLSHPHYQDVYMTLHTYVYQIVLAFLLPVLIVFICNVSVLKKIYQVERTLREDENSASTRLNEASSQRSKTTRLLLTIGFVFVLTLLPANTLTIVMLFAYRLHGVAAQPLILAAIPWNNVLSAITDVNYAANFYLYVLSGRKFRHELRRLLRTDRFRFTNMSVSTRATREEFVLT